MLVVGELGDEKHAFVQVNEGSTDHAFGLRHFEGDSEKSFVDLGVTISVVVSLLHCCLFRLKIKFNSWLLIIAKAETMCGQDAP